jgi:rare lipoprotein A
MATCRALEDTRRLNSLALLAPLVLVLVACSSERAGGELPAWPAQEPPPYPGQSPEAPPSPGGAGSTETAAGEVASSASPLAARYAGRRALEQLRGSATYYADSLAGNRTASGERYRPEAFTAAHRTLPFGTIVRVTRSDNARITYVKINDRGPFAGKERIIDVSKAAAKELDMLRAGVVAVRVDVLELPEKAPR